MKVSHIISLTAAAAAIAAAPARGASPVEAIAPYVYPQNAPASAEAVVHMQGPDTYLTLSADGRAVEQRSVKTGAVTGKVMDVANTREAQIAGIQGFTLSPDGGKLLVWNERQMIYRRSAEAAYYIYDIRTRQLRPLSVKFKHQREPKFSPDSRMVAFVGTDQNIYLKKIDFNSEVAVTTDGKFGSILNGITDWTYEEEFTVTSSIEFTPDSRTLCYMRSDETEVPTYSLTMYEGSCDPKREYALYPGQYSYKYPVAGQPNSSVTLHAYDVDERKTWALPLGISYEYIPRIAATPEGKLLVVTLNRDQNRMEILSVNPASKVVRSVYTYETKAWVAPEAYEDLRLEKDGFFVLSERTGHAALYKYSYAGALLKTIAVPDADVTACHGQDAAGNIYYTAAAPTPMDRTVYRLNAKGRTQLIGAADGWNSATFSSDLSFATVNHSDTDTPPMYTLYAPATGKQVRVMEDNAAYAAKHAKLPRREFFTFDSDGVKLNGWIMRPLDFDPSKKYPVVMEQYSGPGSQSVTHRWGLDWMQYFASQGFIVVCVDARGTGGRGNQFRDIVYMNLGHYETIDQCNAARYVATVPGVDPKRIGICGWSYGGYEALMCATQPNSPFAACVSIAPVTGWRYYDTVYAERYMRTPSQNFEGYRKSAPLHRAADLKCPLLLMYGTADDNVHPSNSIEFVSALQNAGLLCDMLIFPNMNHSINGCNARAGVYANMLRFFQREL